MKAYSIIITADTRGVWKRLPPPKSLKKMYAYIKSPPISFRYAPVSCIHI